jgi:hypothetical protein
VLISTKVDVRFLLRLVSSLARDLIIIVATVYVAHIVLRSRLYFGRLLPFSLRTIFAALFFATAYAILDFSNKPKMRHFRLGRSFVVLFIVGFVLHYLHRPLLKEDPPTLLPSVDRHHDFDHKTAGTSLNLSFQDQALPQVPNSFDFWGTQLIVNDPSAERVVFLNGKGAFVSSLNLAFRAVRIDRLGDQLLLQKYGSPSDADVLCQLTTRECIDMSEATRDQKSELRRDRDAIVDANSGDVRWVSLSPGIGGLRSIGIDSRGNHFVLVERQKPGQQSIERVVQMYSAEHHLIDELSGLRPQPFLYVSDDLRIHGDYLYQMQVSDNGVVLKRWRIL